jgi:hypothetical protein
MAINTANWLWSSQMPYEEGLPKPLFSFQDGISSVSGEAQPQRISKGKPDFRAVIYASKLSLGWHNCRGLVVKSL